jgi:ribosomal protein L11
MSKALLAIVASISLAGIAHAQSKFGDVTMSTDPAKAAAVERQAAELKTQQAAPMPSASGHVNHHHVRHVARHRHADTKAATKS